VIIPERLEKLLNEVRHVVVQRDGTVVIDCPGPAERPAMEQLSRHLGVGLPPGLLALWSVHDGFAVRVYGRDEAPGITSHQLVVRGVDSVLAATDVVREFFAGMRESGNNDYSKEEAARYLDIVDTDDPDHRIVGDLAQCTRPDGDCALVEVSFYSDFVREPPQPLARSLEEFIERSLSFMIETQGGFKYWSAPDTEW
jgi:hypothetical protein